MGLCLGIDDKLVKSLGLEGRQTKVMLSWVSAIGCINRKKMSPSDNRRKCHIHMPFSS